MKRKIMQSLLYIITVIMLFGLVGCGNQSTDIILNISASATFTDALKTINDLYIQENSNVTIINNFSSAGTIQSQIENGSDCDVFVSANEKNMNNLENKGLILSETRINLLSTNIILVIPIGSKLDIKDFNDLTNSEVTQIAIGDPQSVSAGIYADKLFQLLGIKDAIASKLILASNVRDVLNYVETGNVDAGIIFSSDAVVSDKIKVIATAPDEINSQIIMPAAIIKSSSNIEAAKDYLDFLSSEEAISIFESYGFNLINE
jgi:molybdate transport system substrate-binding protein